MQISSIVQPIARRVDNPNQHGPQVPSFLGPSSELYDAQYLQLDRNFGDTGSTNEIIPPFPQPSPETFMSYWEYEVALLDWRASVERTIGRDLQLPQLVGRHVFRPQNSGTTADVSGLASSPIPYGNLSFQDCGAVDTSPEISLSIPPSPRAEPSPSDAFFSGSAGSSGGSITNSLFSASSSLLVEHMPSPSQDPWDALLIPPEPNPHQYQTFDDFYMALLHWVNICNMNHGAELPVPSFQLAGLVPLQRAAKSRANSTAQVLSVASTVSRRRSVWQGMVQQVARQPYFPGTRPCSINSVDISVGVFSSTENHAVKRIYSDYSADRHSTANPPEFALQSLRQQFNGLLNRSHVLFESTGRCSVRAVGPHDASAPPICVDSTSPCLLLKRHHFMEGIQTNSDKDLTPTVLDPEFSDDSELYAEYVKRVSAVWPVDTTNRLGFISSALSAIIHTNTTIHGKHISWERILLGHSSVSFVLDSSLPKTVPKLLDYFLLSEQNNIHASFSVFDALVSEYYCTADLRKRNRAARLFSILLQETVCFAPLLTTLIRHFEEILFGSAELTSSVESQYFWSMLQTFRGCAAVLSHGKPNIGDFIFVTPEAVLLAAGGNSSFLKAAKRLLFLHYCNILSSAIEESPEASGTQARQNHIKELLSKVFAIGTSVCREEYFLHSQDFVQSMLERLNHRSRTVSAVTYFIFSSLIRAFPEGPPGPLLARSIRYLLRSRKRHSVIIATRFSQSQVLQSSTDFLASFCSSVSPDEFLEDITSLCVPVLQFWDAVAHRLIAEAGNLNSYPTIASIQYIIKLQEIICKMRLKPDFEAEASSIQCRLLQARASLLATICHLVMKQSEHVKIDSADTNSQPRIPIQMVAKLIRFIHEPTPHHEACPQVGRAIAFARATVAYGVSLLLSSRALYTELSKSWKKGAKHLHKLTQPFHSKRTRSLEASRRVPTSAVPTSPALALLQSLVAQLKSSSFFEYKFGSILIQSIVVLLGSHSRLCASLFEPPSLGTEKHHSEVEDQQPLMFHILDGLTVGSIGSNLAQWATGGLALPTHCIRLLTILFSVLPERETKLLVEYIIKHHHFIKIHLAFRRIVDYAPGITLTAFGEFYRTVISNPIAFRLRLTDYLDGFERPLCMYADGPELLKNARG